VREPSLAARARRLVIATHRDVGYVVSTLVIAYCVSGVALNHVDVWNPDFVIHRETISVPTRASAAGLTEPEVAALGALVAEGAHRVYDSPTPTQVKIYFDSATLHVDFERGTGLYERVSRRPVFYQVNALHRNSLKPWRWVADVFAALLIVVNATGLFVLKGTRGLGGRGKWLVLLGTLPAIVALVAHG
jgi:hypothetical protein